MHSLTVVDLDACDWWEALIRAGAIRLDSFHQRYCQVVLYTLC